MVVPVKSDSTHSIVADLGKIKLKNSFHVIPITEEGVVKKRALVDDLVVKMSDMRVGYVTKKKVGINNSD